MATAAPLLGGCLDPLVPRHAVWPGSWGAIGPRAFQRCHALNKQTAESPAEMGPWELSAAVPHHKNVEKEPLTMRIATAPNVQWRKTRGYQVVGFWPPYGPLPAGIGETSKGRSRTAVMRFLTDDHPLMAMNGQYRLMAALVMVTFRLFVTAMMNPTVAIQLGNQPACDRLFWICFKTDRFVHCDTGPLQQSKNEHCHQGSQHSLDYTWADHSNRRMMGWLPHH